MASSKHNRSLGPPPKGQVPPPRGKPPLVHHTVRQKPSAPSTIRQKIPSPVAGHAPTSAPGQSRPKQPSPLPPPHQGPLVHGPGKKGKFDPGEPGS